jgi:hypothetical protein
MDDMSRKMRTVEVVNFGHLPWKGNPLHAARIERARVLFSDEDRVREVLKFCYVKNGRHARTHLTISQEDFVSLFRSAVEEHVFSPQVLKGLSKVLSKRR